MFWHICTNVGIYCFVRQCSTSSDSLFNRLEIKGASTYVYYNVVGLYRSRGKFTAYACICEYLFMSALQYTTACLQVLFSSQHLGRITKITQ